MKYLILATLMVFVVAVSANAKEVKTKIGPNHVEIKTIYYKDKAGLLPVTIKTQSYGQASLTADIAVAQSDLTTAKNLNAVTYKSDLIAEKQAIVDDLIGIQAVMDE